MIVQLVNFVNALTISISDAPTMREAREAREARARSERSVAFALAKIYNPPFCLPQICRICERPNCDNPEAQKRFNPDSSESTYIRTQVLYRGRLGNALDKAAFSKTKQKNRQTKMVSLVGGRLAVLMHQDMDIFSRFEFRVSASPLSLCLK